MYKRIIAPALALAAVAGLAACGGGGKSDADQVRDVVELGASNDPKVCDKVTDHWLKEVTGGDKADCERQAKEDKTKVEVKKVTVNGDRATVAISSGGKGGRLIAVKDGDDWRLDDVWETASRGSSESKTAESSPGETAARGAADAFLTSIADEDADVFCGLMSEDYARKLFNRERFGVARCVSAMEASPATWHVLQRRTEGVSSKSVTMIGTSAIVTLTNGHDINLEKQGSRYVITKVL